MPIENLKLVAKTGVDLGGKLAETFEDNKITWQEAFSIITNLMTIPEILKKKEEIKAEWKALTSAQRDELKVYIADELSIPNNPALERKIEKGTFLILDVLDYISEFKKPTV